MTDEKKEDEKKEAKSESKAEAEAGTGTGTETEAETETAAEAAPESTQEDPNVATPAAHVGAAWVQPLVRFDAWWTKWEARLTAGVLGAEIVALVTWVGLKGMSAEYQPSTNAADAEAPVDVSGIIFRAIVSALVLGLGAHFALRPADATKRKTDLRYQVGVSAAVILGLVCGRFWANAGVDYFSNALNWLQGASTLTLLGGLRGLATRLTLWLALLGGSLATAQGKHINVDVVMRFLTPKMRLPVALIGWLAAALVCLSGAWGFVDHLAIAEYKLSMNSSSSERTSEGRARVRARHVPPSAADSSSTCTASRRC